MAWKQASRTETLQTARVRAGRLRRAMTDAEKTLWAHLRGDFAGPGSHFRRQMPIGPYIVDFCCLAHRLVVELDGPIHTAPGAAAHDRCRDEYLAGQRFRVLRFKNEDVTLRREMVLSAIRGAFVTTTPTPGPSPQGGGELHETPR